MWILLYFFMLCKNFTGLKCLQNVWEWWTTTSTWLLLLFFTRRKRFLINCFVSFNICIQNKILIIIFLFYLNDFRHTSIFSFMNRIGQVISKLFTWICRDFRHAFFYANITDLDRNFTASIKMLVTINMVQWNEYNRMISSNLIV